MNITEKGQIRAINGNIVILAPDKSAACFGCMNQECRSNGGLITAENKFALPLEKGQFVEVKAPCMPVFAQAAAALLPPALGFAAGYFLSRLFFHEAGEGAAAGIGAIFLFAAAFIVYRARKKYPAGSEYIVTKIINAV